MGVGRQELHGLGTWVPSGGCRNAIDYRTLRELHPPKAGSAESPTRRSPQVRRPRPDSRSNPQKVPPPKPIHRPCDPTVRRMLRCRSMRRTVAISRPHRRQRWPRPGTRVDPRGEGEAWPAVRVRGYIKAPAPGMFRSYEDLVAIYGEKDAPGLALSAGLDEYMETLATRRNVALPRGFPSAGKRIDTLRTMPARSFDLAVEQLDPRGILGPFQLGSRIFNTALERFLTKA